MLAVFAAAAMHGTDSAELRRRGFEVLEQMRREYYLPESKLYCDSIDSGGRKSGPAFNWGAGVMLSALNAAARLDSKYKPWLREYADASRVYWNDKGPVPGYDVLPCPKPVDRYYDDNAWMVLALVETCEILGDKKYLDWAEQALDYVLSGWDDKLGGGIYWRESDKKSKNACSNAPSAAACMALARHRRRDELIGRAEAIMKWTRTNLQDPKDGLIWDNLDLNGKVDKTKYTYNTGLYLRAWAMLNAHAVIDNSDLVRVSRSSLQHWLDPETGGAKDAGRFVHLWFEGLAWADRENADARAKAVNALDHLYNRVRNKQGRYPSDWDKPSDPNRKKFELIDQASAARGFLFAAEWMRV